MASRFLQRRTAWPKVMSHEKGYSTFEWVSLFAVTLGVIVGTIATIQIGLPEMGRLARGGFERQIAAWEEGSSPEVLYGSGRGPQVGSGEVEGVEPGGGLDLGKIIGGAVEAIKEWVAGWVDQIGQDWEGFKDWLGDAWEGFSSWVQGLWEAAPNWLKGLAIGALVAITILIVAIIIVGTGGIGLVVLLAMLGALLGGLLYGLQAGDGPFSIFDAFLYSGAGAFLLGTAGQSLLMLGAGGLTRVALGAATKYGLYGSGIDVGVYMAEVFLGFEQFSGSELVTRAGTGFVSSFLLSGFASKLIGTRQALRPIGEGFSIRMLLSRNGWVVIRERVWEYMVENVKYIDRHYLMRVYTPMKTGMTMAMDFLKARLTGGDYGAADAGWSIIKGAGTAQIDPVIRHADLGEPDTSVAKGVARLMTNRLKEVWDWGTGEVSEFVKSILEQAGSRPPAVPSGGPVPSPVPTPDPTVVPSGTPTSVDPGTATPTPTPPAH